MSFTSFSQDTAEKTGIGKRTVERLVQIATDLSPETKELIQNSGIKVTQQNLTRLSRLNPEQQKEAAQKLLAGEIKSVTEYQAALREKKQKDHAELQKIIAELKDPEKDCSCTPEHLLAMFSGSIERFQRRFDWYRDP